MNITIEKVLLLLSLFFFSFGIGLMVDGKKIYQEQFKLSQRVEIISTQNPDRLVN